MRLMREVEHIVGKAHLPASQDDHVVYRSLPTLGPSAVLVCGSDGDVYQAEHVVYNEWVVKTQGEVNLSQCTAYIVKVNLSLTTVDDELMSRLMLNIIHDPRIDAALHVIRKAGGTEAYIHVERAQYIEATVKGKTRINQLQFLDITPLQPPRRHVGSIVRLGFYFSGNAQDPALPRVINLLNSLRQVSKVGEYMQAEATYGQGGETAAVLWLKLVADAPQFPRTGDAVADRNALINALRELRNELESIIRGGEA